MDRARTCCFTGHRPEKLPWGVREEDPRCVELKQRLRREAERAYEDGFRHFITGMARGTDQYFAQIVLALKEDLPGITLEAAIPCEEQAARWKESERERYFDLVARCDLETVVQRHYDRGCMQRRNRYMVDRSARLIAAYDGLLGGTMYTIHYALRRGVEVVMVDVEET
jgi:uncharacterized phage-like protein YoqJ